MERIKIEETKTTPLVLFDGDLGILRITGRCIPEYPEDFFEVIFKGIKQYFVDHNRSLEVTMDLEYFNTSSSKKIFELFKSLKGKDVRVIWMFEEGDLDMQEAGEDYQSMLEGMNFKVQEKPE